MGSWTCPACLEFDRLLYTALRRGGEAERERDEVRDQIRQIDFVLRRDELREVKQWTAAISGVARGDSDCPGGAVEMLLEALKSQAEGFFRYQAMKARAERIENLVRGLLAESGPQECREHAGGTKPGHSYCAFLCPDFVKALRGALEASA